MHRAPHGKSHRKADNAKRKLNIYLWITGNSMSIYLKYRNDARTHTHVRDLRVRFKAERDIAFALHCYRYVAYCPFHRHSGSRKAALQSKALSFASRNTRYSCRNVVISARKSRLARLYTEGYRNVMWCNVRETLP